MLKKIISCFLLFAYPSALALAATEPGIVYPGQNYQEPTVVVINSNKWQDSYLATIYANQNGLAMRYIMDPFQTKDFLTELSSNRFTKVVLFNRKDSPIPSLTYLMRTQNLDVREIVFEDHFDLSAKMLDMAKPAKAILVRDDFGFDAISSKYMARQLNVPVIFSKGPEEMDGRVLDSLRKNGVLELYLVGRESNKLESGLSEFKLNKLQGRDEFDTNNIVNDFIVRDVPVGQGMIVTGDIWELSLMNVIDQPIFLVPEFSTYSLTKTADIITKADLKVILGIGRFITESGQWLRQRTGAKLIVKFGSVKTSQGDEGFIQKDMAIRLEGFEMPIPKYDGRILEIRPSYTDPLGPSTGALIARDKPAPPVEFITVFEDTGNIDFPAYIILEVKDENNQTLATLQSERQMVYPKRENIFRIKWENPPAEGRYFVIGKVFGEVYEGLTLPGKETDFELRWIYVIINLLLLLLAILMLVMVAYWSQVLSGDIGRLGGVFRRAGEEFDKLAKYVNSIYHFRRGKNK